MITTFQVPTQKVDIFQKNKTMERAREKGKNLQHLNFKC